VAWLGVEVKLEEWPGMGHEFQGLDFVPEGQLAMKHVVTFIPQHRA
jgi:acetyl esterase/lipase